MGIDQISIEDAHFRNDLRLLEKFPDKKIIFGAINVTKSRLETIDEIRERISEVLNFIEREKTQTVLHVFFLLPLQGGVLWLFDGYLLQHA